MSIVHTVAVLGGTGPQGRGLGYRLARGGHDVVLGARSADRATATMRSSTSCACL